jgi:sugar phosphate isomerase/epimerase
LGLPEFKKVYLSPWSFRNVSKASLATLRFARKAAEEYNMKRLELGFPYPAGRVRDLSPEVEKEVEDIAGSFKVTCHTPMVNLAAWEEKRRRENVNEMIASINFSVEKGADQFVVHLAASEGLLSFIPWPQKSINQKLIQEAGEKSFHEITEYFKGMNLIYGLENLTRHEPGFQDPQDFAHLFNNNVGLVIDTVHAISWKLDPVKLIELYRKHLVEVHLTDGTGRGKVVKHYALGNGNVPLQRVLQKLQEIDFASPVVIEVDSKKDFVASLEWLARSPMQ